MRGAARATTPRAADRAAATSAVATATVAAPAVRTRPATIDVLVLDAQYRQALSTMRTLSRRGLRVGAVACQSDVRGALAFSSRWCRFRSVVPDFSTDPAGYADALLRVLDEHPADVVMPCHDGSIETLRAIRPDLERRTALPLASQATLDIAANKAQTARLAATLGIAVPRSVMLSDQRDLRAALRHTGYPAVIKPVTSWVARNGTGSRLGCEIVTSLSEAQRAIEVMEAAGADVVVQSWLPGRRDAVTLFRAEGRTWATFAQTSYRELPLLGGASVLCESLPPLPELTEPAERLVRAIGLDGCSMVEFRRDRDGRPVLMEVNARMPGSVTLAVSCGVDFPHMLYAWAMNRPLRAVTSYRIGRRLRWLGGDIWNLKSALESAGHPEATGRLEAVKTFLSDFVRRPSVIDVVDATDIVPACIELRQTLLGPAFGRFRELVTGVPRAARKATK